MAHQQTSSGKPRDSHVASEVKDWRIYDTHCSGSGVTEGAKEQRPGIYQTWGSFEELPREIGYILFCGSGQEFLFHPLGT